MKHVVVGCGGIANWMVPALLRYLDDRPPDTERPAVQLVDGDTVEERNLHRQLWFKNIDIGENKAVALHRRTVRPGSGVLVTSTPGWLVMGAERLYLIRQTNSANYPVFQGNLALCCADNHAARLRCLNAADSGQVRGCIIGANEETEAEAYFYRPDWVGTTRDPRVYYPVLREPDTYDPTLAEHCTDGTPQTVLANMLAAAMMLSLYRLWYEHVPGVLQRNPKLVETFPYRLRQSVASGITWHGDDHKEKNT